MRSYPSESEVEMEVRSRSFTFVHDLFGQFMVWSLRTRVGIGNRSLRTQDRLWFWCGCGSGRSLNSQLRRLMIFVISSVSSTSATRVVSGWRIYRSERSHSDSYPLIHVSRSVLCSPKNLLSTLYPWSLEYEVTLSLSTANPLSRCTSYYDRVNSNQGKV